MRSSIIIYGWNNYFIFQDVRVVICCDNWDIIAFRAQKVMIFAPASLDDILKSSLPVIAHSVHLTIMVPGVKCGK